MLYVTERHTDEHSDTLRAKLRGGQTTSTTTMSITVDEGYDEDAGSPHPPTPCTAGSRLLGNPSRPEAESVSVSYTRLQATSTNPAAS